MQLPVCNKMTWGGAPRNAHACKIFILSQKRESVRFGVLPNDWIGVLPNATALT